MKRVRRQRHADTLLTVGVGALVVVSVAAIGAVHPATQVVLSAGAFLLFGGYGIVRGRSGFGVVPFAAVAAVGLAVTILQLAPLPAGLVAIISPPAYQLRSQTDAGRFFPLTLDAPATWLALARGAACTGILLVVGSLVRSPRHACRLLLMPAIVGAGLALVGLVQRLIGTNTIAGAYTPRSMPGVGVFGTFVDVNHAASVLALGLFAAIGVAVDTRSRQQMLAVGCAVACGVALVVTSSRGALFAAGVAGYVLLTALIARRGGIARAAVAATVILVVVGGTLLWTHDQLRAKVASPSALVDNQKTHGWAEAFRMAGDYTWAGVGRGAFAAPIAAYRRSDEGVRLVYPENVLAQLASEWGFPAALIVIGLFVRTAARLLPTLARMPAAIVAASCGVLAVLVHELFDFGLEFPGVAFPTVLTLALVVGAVRRDDPSRSATSFRLTPARLAPIVVAWMLILGGAAWAVGNTLDADWSRMHDADVHNVVDARAIAAAIKRHPADDFLELIAARAAVRHAPVEAMRHLNRALALHPANWQAHRLAAHLLLAAHRPAQAALEFRLASHDGLTMPLSELMAQLGPRIVDAVDPTPAALDDLAEKLYALGKPIEADTAARRAVDVAADREGAMRARVRLAIRYKDKSAAAAAGKALAAEASSVESYATAAQALANAGDSAGSLAALVAGDKSFPKDVALLLAGADALLEVGDARGARARIEAAAHLTLTLPERQHAEELLALAAERSGDSATAEIARTRARLIARQLHDMSLSP